MPLKHRELGIFALVRMMLAELDRREPDMNWNRVTISVAMVILAVAATTAQAQRKTKKRGVKLPPAVAAALKANCADCTIAKVTRETEDGVKIYDFEFLKTQGEMDVTVDGTVVNRETPIDLNEMPGPTLEAIRKAANGGKIILVEKEETRAELKAGKITKLDSPKYAYEADLAKGNKVGEVVVTAEGQITEGPKWRKKGSKED